MPGAFGWKQSLAYSLSWQKYGFTKLNDHFEVYFVIHLFMGRGLR